MTRARLPRPHEVQAAAVDPRFLEAQIVEVDAAWRTKGRCRTVDPETFFPLPTEPADMALALCRSCPVQSECLRAALDAGDAEGVWGATTPRERRAMLMAWRSWKCDTVESNPLSPSPSLAPAIAAGLRSSSRGSTRSPIHAPRNGWLRSGRSKKTRHRHTKWRHMTSH